MPNDYFLTKIYESLKNRPSSIPKTPPKKFQSLQQSYYQVILKQINEDTDILMQQKGSENVEEFTVDDDVASRIKLEINKKTISEIIDKVLKSKKWHEGAESYSNLLNDVLNIFSEKKINLEEIKKYLNLVNDKDESVVEKILANNQQTPISLNNLIPKWFNNFFEDKNGLEIASKLWDLRFKQKNMVGKGELLFTLISDCRKGDKDSIGDLFFDSLGSIEVKGMSGTVGGDGFVNVNTSKLLNGIYSQKSEETPQLSLQIINRSKNNIFKTLDDIIKDFKRRKPLNLKQIEEIKFKMDNLESYSEIQEFIDQIGFKTTEKEKLISKIEDFLKRKRTYGPKNSLKDNNKLNIFKNDYAHSLQAFFTSYLSLSDKQLVDGIIACRSYKEMPPQEFENYLEKEIIPNKNLFFSESALTKKLINLIATLHVIQYQENKNINGFIFMNDNTKKIIFYSFEDKISYTEKFKSFYTFLDDFKPTISISMSDQQKSVNLAFTKIISMDN